MLVLKAAVGGRRLGGELARKALGILVFFAASFYKKYIIIMAHSDLASPFSSADAVLYMNFQNNSACIIRLRLIVTPT